MGADPGVGRKPRPGNSLREKKEEIAEGPTRERKEDPLLTGEKIQQEKEGLGGQSIHLKEPGVRGESRPGKTRKDAKKKLEECLKEERQTKPSLTGEQMDLRQST